MEKIQVLFILTFLPCGHQLFEKRKQFMPIPNEIVSSSCYWQIIETTVKNRIPSELDLFRKWGKLGWIWFILVVAVQPQTILQIHTAIASITRASDHMVLLTFRGWKWSQYRFWFLFCCIYQGRPGCFKFCFTLQVKLLKWSV